MSVFVVLLFSLYTLFLSDIFSRPLQPVWLFSPKSRYEASTYQVLNRAATKLS
ncbi:unnamed protein product [Nippostrongylus brasiliensis]|uniref:Secreted protein n=1 Tax=Nippostrongylus brasiliensis TaxID=27835 RepID=A0A0N4XT05_NIPBR|nr:unnamed protein product [Nippostrongylus brasiliensis]